MSMLGLNAQLVREVRMRGYLGVPENLDHGVMIVHVNAFPRRCCFKETQPTFCFNAKHKNFVIKKKQQVSRGSPASRAGLEPESMYEWKKKKKNLSESVLW